ncbi:hypothetical protein [Natrinema halophilum]|uniref:hypothetical protein n=1 Tax=Natrinema halophilum TaxID=1699371 RepID=UPI001F35600F|nr:hypothetical protein [Natrinema halophilum]UHQ96078.1 hypothetical protein HYG82_22375 [Natrinema halophilum]
MEVLGDTWDCRSVIRPFALNTDSEHDGVIGDRDHGYVFVHGSTTDSVAASRAVSIGLPLMELVVDSIGSSLCWMDRPESASKRCVFDDGMCMSRRSPGYSTDVLFGGDPHRYFANG